MHDRILVAYDGSDGAGRALQEALRLAKDHNATLLLVHVLDESAFLGSVAEGVIRHADVPVLVVRAS